MEEIVCIEEKNAGNCLQFPWNGKCRKTCELCGMLKKVKIGARDFHF